MVIDTLSLGASANFKEYENELPSTIRGSFGTHQPPSVRLQLEHCVRRVLAPR